MMKALTESNDMPNDIKEKITSLVEVASSYPRLWVKKLKEDREE